MQNNQTTLTLTRPDDWHVHLRDGAILAGTVAHTAAQFARAVVMPNLKPPVRTAEQALAYKARILQALSFNALPAGTAFEPLMVIYLTETTTAAEIIAAKAAGIIGAKLYPAGATTNSDAGVRDLLANCKPALESMQRVGLPLLVHGEVTDTDVDLFDREAVFIDRVMLPLRAAYPALNVVFEHITTQQAAEYVRDAQSPHAKLGATITPQHLLYNRNALFTGGMRPHYYCLPVLKRESHRVALVKAATSGNPAFFLGTDTAPHAQGLKENACGCAGCFTGLHALELYAAAFETAGALDKLEGFASHFGADFYGLPRNTDTVTLHRQTWTIPPLVDLNGTAVVPLAAGETLHWKLIH